MVQQANQAMEFEDGSRAAAFSDGTGAVVLEVDGYLPDGSQVTVRCVGIPRNFVGSPDHVGLVPCLSIVAGAATTPV